VHVLLSAEEQSVRACQRPNSLAKMCLGSSAGCSRADGKSGWLDTAFGSAKTDASLHKVVPSWRGPTRAGHIPARRTPCKRKVSEEGGDMPDPENARGVEEVSIDVQATAEVVGVVS